MAGTAAKPRCPVARVAFVVVSRRAIAVVSAANPHLTLLLARMLSLFESVQFGLPSKNLAYTLRRSLLVCCSHGSMGRQVMVASVNYVLLL